MRVFEEQLPDGRFIRYTRDHFVYVADAGAALAPGANARDTIQIEADSDFVWVKTAFYTSIAGGAQTAATLVIPNVTMEIQDGGSGRLLQSEPTPIPSIAGTGQLPFVLPVPRDFRANSSININFASFEAVVIHQNLRVEFIGYKKFYLGQPYTKQVQKQ